MDLNEKIRLRRQERYDEALQQAATEKATKEAEWINSGGRKKRAARIAKIILLPVYALFGAVLAVGVWAAHSLIFN